MPPPIEEPCDCISVFEPNTRWRFRYRASEIKNGLNLFSFNIFTVPSDYCMEVNYRPGACCDQTLDEIEVTLAPEWRDNWIQLVTRFWLFDTDDSIVQSGRVSTQQKGDTGLRFSGLDFNTSTVPPGTELVLTLALNASLWNDTNAFPCGPSVLVDDDGRCDYSFRGKQVRDGQLVQPIPGAPYGAFVPGCCPDGVYLIQNPTGLCGCTDNGLESPYRLAADPNPVAGTRGSTRYSFAIDTVKPVPPVPGAEVNCNNMDLDAVRLYVRPEVVGAVRSVVLNNITIPAANITFGNDTRQVWMQLNDLGRALPAAGSSWALTVILAGVAPPSVCAPNALGTSECEYVFYGKFSVKDLEYQCCAHGFSEAAPLEQEPDQCGCDTNVLHTPYRLDLASSVAVAGATSLNFTLTYDSLDCDAADPLNGGCCASDLKSIFIELEDTTVFASASVSPAVPGGVTVQKLPSGVRLTGLFGMGAGYDVSLKMSSNMPLSELCGAGGCKYRLEGGFAFNQPFGCCPESSTGA